ncbi:MAG: bifunctional isocitrate dehydrogenase kinase/phosphatase, partial [Burkholderiaceae bacterium]|nr:bifunctional isocitrate dehydrogenase kinase/phosphatase [Burkholderiaceae bacterium]
MASASDATEIANLILSGFHRHYGLFRYNAQQAKTAFEAGRYGAIRELAKERIAFYDERVKETTDALMAKSSSIALDEGTWAEVKKAYIMLLTDHKQPELAESFFNSITTRILRRANYGGENLFVRPAVATDYLDSDPPSYRVYYPRSEGLQKCLTQMAIDFGLACGWNDIQRDLRRVIRAATLVFPRPFQTATDFQVHVLRSLFFRNKGAYIIGRIMNDGTPTGFAVPVLGNSQGALYLDTILFDPDQISVLFSFSRAYFMVDMEVPSAYVQFLRSIMPHKPASELYTMLGLQKQGKTLFYRDFLHHLRHSNDKFCLAEGIKGLVMLV